MVVNELLEQIDKGRGGDNWGLPTGMPKLEHYTDGVSKETYTVICGGSGSGKTSFCLYSYIYRPVMDNLDNDLFHVIYYSLEMSRTILFAKLLSIYIYETYHRIISVKDLFSKHRNELLSQEDYDIVQRCIPWLHQVEKKIIIYDKLLNADLLRAHLHEELKNYGRYEEKNNKLYYVENDSRQIILVVVDHVGLMRRANGRTLKEEIDLASSIMVAYRNRCKISPVMVSQLNRESQSMPRRSAAMSEPIRADIKDTGNLEQDSEIILALYDPIRDKLSTHRGYDVTEMRKRYRSIILLKNRYGDGDIAIGTAYFGEICSWRELPKAEEIDNYDSYNSLNPPSSGETQVKDDKHINTKTSFTL